MSQAVIGAQSRQNIASTAENRRLVAGWLFAVCFMIWVMVGIGGYTRDSGSGLSIMDWDPIIGTLPPLSTDAWNKVFALYQTIPQYKILHQGMDLAGFKAIFWPEYIHRLWGRMIGVVFVVPLIGFIITRRLEARLIPWLILLFFMGGLQGAIGWFMVSSGFDPNSTAVEPWRLSLHFSAAMFLFTSVFWTALTVLRPKAELIKNALPLKITAFIAAACLILAMFAGTFVSGTHAIDVYNPAAGIGVGAPPPGYPHVNFFADRAAILFNHQTAATLAVIAILTTTVMALRGNWPARVRDAGLLMGGFVVLQFTLGVTALVSKIMDVGVAHQLDSVLLLTACLYMMHNLRGATR